MYRENIPDYLVADLVPREEKKRDMTEQKRDSLWRRIDVAGIPIIVRTDIRTDKQ
jgi:hypothetical protein